MNISPNKNHMGNPSTSMKNRKFLHTCTLPNFLHGTKKSPVPAYFQVNHVKHLGKRVKFPGIEPLPNTPRFTPRQWQSIPLLPACDWKTKPPQRWGFGGFAIITCRDLPRGAEWMIRAAYTPSLRVQNSTLWWNNPKKLGETLKSPRDLLPTDTNL